jgi:hypothetical protein
VARRLTSAEREALARQSELELAQLGFAKTRELSTEYYGTQLIPLGVTVPRLRGVVRAHAKALKEVDARDVIALAQALVDGRTMDGRQVGYELVEAHPSALEAITGAQVERLGRGNDNWCSVDGYCTSLAGRAWNQGGSRMRGCSSGRGRRTSGGAGARSRAPSP